MKISQHLAQGAAVAAPQWTKAGEFSSGSKATVLDLAAHAS
jgi:hypothetical protein